MFLLSKRCQFRRPCDDDRRVSDEVIRLDDQTALKLLGDLIGGKQALAKRSLGHQILSPPGISHLKSLHWSDLFASGEPELDGGA